MSGAIPPSDERDDDELLRQLVDGKPVDGPRTPEREAYEDLIDRIRDLPDIPPPAGWEERLEAKRASREREARRQRLWRRAVPAAFAVLSAAAVILIYVQIREPKPADAVSQIRVSEGSGPKKRTRMAEGHAAVGNEMTVTAARTDPFVELRIYLEGKQFLRCPGKDSRCLSKSPVTARFELTSPGEYRFVIIGGAKAIIDTDEDMDVAVDQLDAEYEVDPNTLESVLVN